MCKYKEGDKFIIEIGPGQPGGANMMYYRVKGANTYLTEGELDRLTNLKEYARGENGVRMAHGLPPILKK